MTSSLLHHAFTVHPNRYDTTIEQYQIAWPDIVEHVLSPLPIQANKDYLPCFVPVQWKSPTGAKERVNVHSVHMLVLDLDENLTLAALKALVERVQGHQHFMHLTHGCHKSYLSEGTYKARVIIPLSKPIPAQRWGGFWEKAKKYFGEFTLDPACKNPNRLYYLPAAPDRAGFDWMTASDGMGWCSAKVDGEPLDVEVIEAVKAPATAAPLPTVATPLPLIEAELRKEAKRLGKNPSTHPKGVALEAMLNGVTYSDDGDRHNMMVQLTWLVAAHYPQREPEVLASLFERSHEEMGYLHETPPDSIEKVAEAIRSAQDKIKAQLADRDEFEAQVAANRMKVATGVRDADYLYTPEELQEIAGGLGIDVDELRSHWIMIAPSGRDIFMVTKQGLKEFTFTHETFAASIGYLQPAGIRLHNIRGTEKAPRKEVRSLKDMAPDHATVLNRVRYDNRLQHHVLQDNELTFPCPKRRIDPIFHPCVDTYLRELFGSSYDKAQDWLAWFPDTRALLCALFITGEPGIGKGLLIDGVSKIWQYGAPVEFKNAMARFNFDIVKTPLIVSDEGLPKEKNVSEMLRRFTASREFQVEKKMGGLYQSLGARRVIIATNNKMALNFRSEGLEKSDMEALQERIWVCEGGQKAKKFLESLTQSQRTQMADHDIAAHVMWLEQNTRPAEAHARFAVVGSTDISANLVLADIPSQKIFTILKQIMDDDENKNANRPVIRLHGTTWGNGRVYISGPDIKKEWDNHKFRDEVWTNPNVHLKKVGFISRVPGGKRVKSCRINTSLFYEFLEDYAGVDSTPYREVINARIEGMDDDDADQGNNMELKVA